MARTLRHSGAPPQGGEPGIHNPRLAVMDSRLSAASRPEMTVEGHEERAVHLLEAAVIGTGWWGGIRAETLARSALCKKLHVCEIRPDRLAGDAALPTPPPP